MESVGVGLRFSEVHTGGQVLGLNELVDIIMYTLFNIIMCIHCLISCVHIV